MVVIVILLFVGLLFLPIRQFVGSRLFVADGRNLLQNGSFESGDGADTADERFVNGPSNCKNLCDGSRTIDGWEVSGKGGGPSATCSNGKVAGDAVCWVINPPECPPQSPPCNGFGVGAQHGNRFVDLTGFANRPPADYGTVSQTVPTEIGKTYQLSFWIGSSSDPRFAAEGLGVSVGIPGITSRFFSAGSPQVVSQWVPQGPSDSPFRFKAVSQTTTLKFQGAVSQGKGSLYIGIDNVSLEKVCFIVVAALFGCP